jgi:hypothetical protein
MCFALFNIYICTKYEDEATNKRPATKEILNFKLTF